MVAEGPDGPVTFAFRVVGVEDCGGASSQRFLVVQRTARLAGSIRREAAYQAPVFWRAQQLQPRWQSRPRFERAAFGCGIESRKAHALAERRGSRGARVCEMRQQTTYDRRLSAVRLNDVAAIATAAILTSSASALVGGQPSRAGPSPASTGRAAAAQAGRPEQINKQRAGQIPNSKSQT